MTNPLLFDDEPCICVKAATITNLESLINSELLSVNNRLNANKLILHALKTKALTLPANTLNLKITIDSFELSVVDSVKYLGFYGDNKLTHLKSNTMFLTVSFCSYIL